ncbi:MAG TPA: NADH:flavin oxidoreductase [Planctomycetota bacterium]|nr:NADH:flavin oxidoreductase [Planctomycetota bacterium]
MTDFPKLTTFKTTADLRARLTALKLDLPLDETLLPGAQSPLAQPFSIAGHTLGNRWCIHPMEGWDGTLDGKPTEPTIRRWRNFGRSGAKWIWGGEAVAVRHDGRANPNQLLYNEANKASLGELLKTLKAAHQELHGTTRDLFVGLQLTHSGRFARPNDKKKLEPRTMYAHPILDAKFHVDPKSALFSDTELDDLIGDFVVAAKGARELGFNFVDLKHCHGYLGHEILSAHTRPGPYGGSLQNRMRFLQRLIEGVQREAPGLLIGVRLSAIDTVPHKPDPAKTVGRKLGPGIPEPFSTPYPWGFGVNPGNPLEYDLAEPIAFCRQAAHWGVPMFNISVGSPYYVPHIQRPAFYPPSDGYTPPEDPLVGVARQIEVTRRIREALDPAVKLVGTGYSYLQEFLPQVAQAVVRQGWVDSVGIGRLVLSYPEFPSDCFKGELQKKLICRTFSDCTTAPRNGMISGCFPLDPYYKEMTIAKELKVIKAKATEG